MTRLHMKIDGGSKVLIVEDMKARMDWFYEELTGVEITHAETFPEAVLELSRQSYDVMFLDHDLGHPELDGDGRQVAEHIQAHGYVAPFVVIHSWNPAGARNMKSSLENAIIAPFGSFTVEVASRPDEGVLTTQSIKETGGESTIDWTSINPDCVWCGGRGYYENGSGYTDFCRRCFPEFSWEKDSYLSQLHALTERGRGNGRRNQWGRYDHEEEGGSEEEGHSRTEDRGDEASVHE